MTLGIIKHVSIYHLNGTSFCREHEPLHEVAIHQVFLAHPFEGCFNSDVTMTYSSDVYAAYGTYGFGRLDRVGHMLVHPEGSASGP